MDLILLGSNDAKGLVVLFPKPEEVDTPPPEIGKPSTTYNGSLLAFIEVPPLILILKAASGPPSELTTCTPATFDANAPSNEVVFILSISSDLIVETAPVKSFLFTDPYPITTISSNIETSEKSVTLILVLSPTTTSLDLYPR